MVNKKSGFTLMEIMVVIIVIAVLASVAGPMIGSITDQGRASATKSKLSSLKSALLAFKNDVGRFPYYGDTDQVSKVGAYNATKVLSPTDPDKNVLTTNDDLSGAFLGNYQKRWKGPYMDSDPSDFMTDSWGGQIKYIAQGKNLYLWSYGIDGAPYGGSTSGNVEKAFKDQTDDEKGCDDIVISVAKFRKPFTN